MNDDKACKNDKEKNKQTKKIKIISKDKIAKNKQYYK